jgi:hypothetical protein
MAFGENVDPSAAIRGIIGLYPFSAGIFRELLQNSDDAGAKKQVCTPSNLVTNTDTLIRDLCLRPSESSSHFNLSS